MLYKDTISYSSIESSNSSLFRSSFDPRSLPIDSCQPTSLQILCAFSLRKMIKSTLFIHLLLVALIKCTAIEQSIDQDSTQSPNELTKLNEPEQSSNQRCDDARLKCAFRLDCGQALTSYMIHCADLIAGTVDINRCPSKCFRALVALASTEHGAKLVDCDCGDSQFCKLSKERVDVCKAKVEHEIADSTVVSCSTAKFICSSNTQCLTALTYYNKFCKAMFKGKHCSKRCLNSLNILQRQKNAFKLRTCVCDGTEDFPCEAIKQNTELLCLKRANFTDTSIELLSNGDHRPMRHRVKHRHQHKAKQHHHKFDFEHRRPSRHRQQPSFSADSDAPGQFETSPIDLDQIKNFKYFDIMISEALSSNATQTTVSSSIYLLTLLVSLLNSRFLIALAYRS